MSSRIYAALEATELDSRYKDRFKQKQMNDIQVSLCIKSPSYKLLSKVIDSPEDYDLFVDAFTNPHKFQNQVNNNNLHTFYSLEPHSPNSRTRILSRSPSPINNILENFLLSTEAAALAGDQDDEDDRHSNNGLVPPTENNNSSLSSSPNTKSNLSRKPHFFSNIKIPSFSKLEPDAQDTTYSYFNPTIITPMSPPLKVQPVQIIDIPLKDGRDPSSSSLIFNHKQLAGILSRIGRRPVALLTIAGPSRQGKSFILGYMLRYLQALSRRSTGLNQQQFSFDIDQGLQLQLDSDWMGKSEYKKNQPLLGGFLWRSGVERETTGIWMWPEAFPIRGDDGTEFDVLLVDTQGVFDDYTDKKDWATIVGLSLLTSSCLIFNISHSLQEDSLITLKEFMDFGLMAKSDNANSNVEEKPFQKLMFLIRDWNSPDDYPYGAEGGAAYLHWNLERKNNKNGAHLRSQIKQCFQQLDCFLMPEPGPFVRRKTFDGSVAGMGPEFAENIERFIEHLFDPSTFPCKIISGNLVTGDDLLTYFEQFVRIFNSDQMPTPEDMNQATAFICNQTIVNKCLAVYEQSMVQQQLQAEEELERSFLLEKELLSKNESAIHQTLELYHYSRKMGTQEEINRFKSDLLQRIGNSFKLTTVMNQAKQQESLKEATLQLETIFISLMEEKLAESSTGSDEFVPDSIFETIFEESQQSSQTIFQEILHISSLHSIPKALENFQAVILSLKEPMKLHNKMRMRETENKQREDITKLSQKYRGKMLQTLGKCKYWTPQQLQGEQEAICLEIISNFRALYGESSLHTQGTLLLSQSLQEELDNLEKVVEMQNSNYLLSCSQLVTELASNYSLRMEESASDEGELSQCHQLESKNCLNSLKNSEDFDRLSLEESDKLVQDLRGKIETTCKLLVDKWFPRIRQRLIKNYKERINALFYSEGERPFDHAMLEENHKKLKTQVLTEFQKFANEIPSLIPPGKNQKIIMPIAKIIEDFELEIDNHMETIYEKNKLRAEALEATINGILSKAKSLYVQLSNHINEACHSHSKFSQLSQEAGEQILQYVQEECDTNPDLLETIPREFDVQPLLLQLREFMQDTPQFKKVGPNTLEISGPSLKFSRELGTLENIVHGNSFSSSASSSSTIKEIRWIATKELYVDENLCGEFWSGLNLAIYSKKMNIVGNERLIVVSGENGKSAPAFPPPTPRQPGTSGLNGGDGEPGESGGNVVILAEEIVNAHNLRIISNGGHGGSGQPGGNGSNGQNGTNGDERYHMTMADLEMKFPSPAKFVEVQVKENLRRGLQSMRELAEDVDQQISVLECVNTGSRCWTFETRQGAIFRYGFYQGNMKGLISGRSFYVWFQGAPGTLGQGGGKGGLGGRGGYPGNPGTIEVPKKYEGGGGITVERRQGVKGADGRKGAGGKNGEDGVQGIDLAIVDPYAGLYFPSNFLSKKRFSGRLEMFVVDSSRRDGAAYCPHEREYISFTHTIGLREGIQIYDLPQEQQIQKPLKNTRKKTPIRKDALAFKSFNGSRIKSDADENEDLLLQPGDKFTVNGFTPTPTVGRSNDFFVEESELRCCIENEFLSTSVIDTYANILHQFYTSTNNNKIHNNKIAYLPSTAFCFTGDKWSIAQYLEDMIQNIKDSPSYSSLTTVATIASAGKHWMLFVANASTSTGQIGIVDTLCGYCNDEKLNDGIIIFIKILDAIFGERDWNAKYFLEVAKQILEFQFVQSRWHGDMWRILASVHANVTNDSHSCGPAVLYFLEQLYLNKEIKCNDPRVYQQYRKTIVEKILQTTEEGKGIIQEDNVYTRFLCS